MWSNLCKQQKGTDQDLSRENLEEREQIVSIPEVFKQVPDMAPGLGKERKV